MLNFFCKFIFMVSLLLVSLASYSKSEKAPEAWQKSMRSLARSLQDGYPFLYSKSEFRSPSNRDYVMRTLNGFINTTHALPEDAGKRFIGAEPLLREARNSFKGFAEARRLYSQKKYDQAQSRIHGLVQNCFACHTAYQVGPGKSGSKAEITGIASPFQRSKVVVLGALREFEGALNWIEDQAGKPIAQKFPMDLAKLYLVISLRSLQDFDRARSYLATLANRFKGENSKSAVIKQWQNDISKWEAGTKISYSKKSEENFVAYLRESLKKHSTIRGLSQGSIANAKIYFDLAEVYKNFELDEFSYLSKIYYRACLRANPTDTQKRKCSAALSVKM